MSYDTRCYELAKVFLSDFEIPSQAKRDKLTHQLAQDIQDSIEDFLATELGVET